MRRLLVPAAVALIACSFALLQGSGSGQPAPAPVPALLPVPPQTLGVATCASMACHHANGDLGSQGSEYSTWAAVDPHARAYQALFNDTSKKIQRLMLRGKAGPPAHKDQLCLMCHGMGANLPQAVHADGAGCEQCHGPAQHWKNTHYLNNFDRKTPGFLDLRDNLYVRAKTCMKCHVGDGSREVNHDLIAAGHPRLKFEYGAFYANYPRHWTYREVKERKCDPAREARNWLLGQVVSAESALELLATRAARAPKHAPWPEFSEYDCSACHHGLKEPSERRRRMAERAAAIRAQGRKYVLGNPPWQAWYTGNLERLAGGRVPAANGAKLKQLLLAIHEEMNQREPARGKINNLASQAAALLHGWAESEARLPPASLNQAALLKLTAQVAGNSEFVREGWDGGTQTYLGLAALNHALVGLGARSKGASLLEMRKQLRGSFPMEARPLYDSPSSYRPGPLLELLKNFR